MRYISIIIIAVAFCLSGCVRPHIVDPHTGIDPLVAEINQQARTSDALVLIADMWVAARYLELNADSTYFFDPNRKIDQVVATEQIQEIAFYKKGRAADIATLSGLLIGGAAGAFIGHSDGDDPTCNTWGCSFFQRTYTADQKATIGAVILGIGSAALLRVMFSSAETKDVYRFTAAQTPAAPVIVKAFEKR